MSFVRPQIDRLAGYVPGEQPQESGWIKLNTNENPYPPSPRVRAALKSVAEGRLQIYPDPLSSAFCRAAGKLFDIDPECILPANGSDENLTILIRTYVDAGETIAYPYPSYVLYETLAEIQGAQVKRLLLNRDWSWDLDRTTQDVENCKLLFVPNPNSPSGNAWKRDDLRKLIPPQGLLVLDEAYGDFHDQPHRGEILHSPDEKRIVITRTFSKSYSLAGIRFGFAMADAEHVRQMRKVKDSYNCNMLSLAAATAAIEDQDWMLDNAAKIRTTRTRLMSELQNRGFNVVDSQANFVWATHPQQSHREIYERLKQNKILIRYMQFPHWQPDEGEPADGLRITVGTDDEISAFLEGLDGLL